ncbi:MAG: hypothetical protein HRT90_00005, partial [Candidatus Margulisbacteria bacterium]|nr:hypothetical protein [Candidatus Margulisiibacteriota bacterium]
IEAIPLVGSGIAYQKKDISPIIKNKVLPSGGFLRHLSSLAKDLRSGLIMGLHKQRKAIKHAKHHSNMVICVGDVFCLLMASLGKKVPIYFVPTAKSSKLTPHSILEATIMKRAAHGVFTRDALTASDLQNQGVNAYYLGNPMMDNLDSTGETFGIKPTDKVVGILPGSRKESLENFSHILKVIEILHKDKVSCKFIAGVSDDFSLDGLFFKSPHWRLTSDRPLILSHLSEPINVTLTDKFTDVLHMSQLIIGLAGTANEQAIFMGKPVICFQGFGPQSTLTRFLEQQKLMGKGLYIVANPAPKEIANQVKILLKLHTSNKKMSPQNASKRIIQHVLNDR